MTNRALPDLLLLALTVAGCDDDPEPCADHLPTERGWQHIASCRDGATLVIEDRVAVCRCKP